MTTALTQADFLARVTFDASGKPLQETFDLNSGGHAKVALAPGQTLTSLGNDKMTGSATGATTFRFDGVYGAGAIVASICGANIARTIAEAANSVADLSMADPKAP